MNPGRVLSIGVAVVLGMLAAIQLASPDALGISPVAARWLGIVAAGLGILQGFLPRVQGPTKDPEILADRVADLSQHDQQLVVSDVAARASASETADAVPLLAGAVGSLTTGDRQRLVEILERQRMRAAPADPGSTV